MNTIEIPSLTTTPQDLAILTTLLAPTCRPTAEPTRVTFASCDFLTPTAVAYLGGLVRLATARQAPLIFDWTTLQDHLRVYLRQIGLLPRLGIDRPAHHHYAIPYREDPITGPHSDLAHYLDHAWLDRPWLRLSAAHRHAIVGRLLEIYANACDHSHSFIGIFTAGQHYPRSRHVLFATIDLGHGIPATVRAFLQRPDLPGPTALRWAFQRGHTTQPTRPRGLGLNLLASFIRVTHGRLDLLSGDAHIHITAASTTIRPLPFTFPGTAVRVSLQSDAARYRRLTARSS
jgi:hypothetical protein